MLKKVVNDIKKGLYNAVNELGYVDESVIKIPEDMILDSTKDKENGDYATNTAMRLAKVAKKKPLDIASEIVSKFDASAYHISKVEIAGPGFINLTIDKHYLLEIVLKSLPTHSSPFTFVIMSPVFNPASAAGEPSIGSKTTIFSYLSCVIYIPIPT